MFKKLFTAGVLLAAGIVSSSSWAGGISLAGTRLIYPAGQKQSSITVKNTSADTRYMVQSWLEDASGKKTSDFIVTPPLYVSNPSSENSLRLMYVGPELPKDKESLFYLTTRSVPAIDKSKLEGKNLLMFSAATRIKVFVRPEGLSPDASEAPAKLSFSRSGTQVTAKNPTPYYITMIQIKSGSDSLRDAVMVPPFGEATFTTPSAKGTSLTYRSVNDYGGISDEYSWKM